MTKLVAIGAAIFTALIFSVVPASGYHIATMCDWNSGEYSNNQYRSLAMVATNYAVWDSNLNYYAIRVDPAGHETYRQLIPGSVRHDSWTPDKYDRWRRTVIQRAGSALAVWYIEEWSHASCGW